MSPLRKTTRMLQAAKEILRLENELAYWRAEFHRLAESADEASDEEPTVENRPSLARTSSLLQRVQSVLDSSAKPLTAIEIAMRLGEANSVDSIRAALSRLLGRETVERIAPGLYRSIGGGHRRAAGEDD